MTIAKKIIVTGLTYMIASIGSTIGTNLVKEVWANGLGEKVGMKAKKLLKNQEMGEA